MKRIEEVVEKIKTRIIDLESDEIESNLTLQEISDQLIELGFKGVFYVWYEWDLTGRIYQYGNYKPYDFWVEHGTTKGYA